MTRKHFEDVALEGALLEKHIATLLAKQPGVIVTRAASRTLLDVLLGRGGRDARLCNAVGVPVLFPKGDAHHERVVLCITDAASEIGAAEVALDLARMFDVSLSVLRVKLPAYLQAAAAATDRLMETIAHRARLHGMQPVAEVIEGNPIGEWVAASTSTDLAVVSRRASLRDSFSTPDLALRFARASKGSVLVLTVED
jgi:hypothetical protein